jgi:hypothetical protein
VDGIYHNALPYNLFFRIIMHEPVLVCTSDLHRLVMFCGHWGCLTLEWALYIPSTVLGNDSCGVNFWCRVLFDTNVRMIRNEIMAHVV